MDINVKGVFFLTQELLPLLGAETPPTRPILAVSIADLEDTVIAVETHPSQLSFDDHPLRSPAAVLVQLDVTTAASLEEALLDGWLTCAPADLADQDIAGRGDLPRLPDRRVSGWRRGRRGRCSRR